MGGLTVLGRLVVSLDMLLTGKSERECLHTLGHKPNANSTAWWLRLEDDSDIYYLSDGGYSRIAWSDANRCVFLCMGARDEVQARWNDPDVVALRAAIDRLLKEALDANS